MKKVKGLTKRIAAMLMSGMLIVGAVPGTVLASENQADIGQTSEIAAEVLEGAETEEVSSEVYSEDAVTQEEAPLEDATVQYYTVTLDANGGYFENEWDDALGETVEKAEVVEKQIPVDGTVVSFPVFTDPDGRSMVFVGWSLERDGELVAQAGEEYAPVDNCVLYAVWEAEDTSVEDPGSQESDEENTDEIDAAQDSGEAVAAEEIQDVQDSGEAVTAEEIQDVQDSGEVEAAEESQSIQDYEEEEETAETQSVQDYEEAEAAEESLVDDNPASDADANPENIDENEQAIASDQEAVYEDEDIENSSEKSSDSEVSEEEIQPEQNKSSKEEETVWEDAAKGVVESGTCGDHLTWTLNDMGTLTITGTGDMEDYSIFGSDVPWYDSSTTITKVTIGNGVTRIGDSSFQKCSNLTSISIPEGMTSIGKRAFLECGRLTSVNIPNSVTSIGDSAFSGCSSMPSVGIPNSVTSIGRNAFYGCSSLTSVSIPNSVTSIGDQTFSGCGSLTSVVFPNSLTSIGMYAFKTCSSLKSVTIPNNVASIGGWAFAECSSLESVTIPNSVTSIGTKAFHNTPWQNAKGDFSIINGILLEYQGEDTNVIIPEGVTSIGGSAFERCTSLKSVTIPEGVRSIGDSAFNECSSLTSVTIPESMTLIEEGAFYGCRSVTDVYYESSKDKWTEVSIRKGNLAFENVIHYVIDKAIITGLSSKTYTGTALIQSPVVTLGGTALSEGIDYTVSYSNNINAGTVIVTITGTGDYMGTITATFMINKAAQSITASDLSLTYLSSGKISVSGNQGALTYKSSDTTIATVNNSGNVTAKGVGTATITITAAATENYMAATKTVTVKVSAATIADFDVTLESTSYTYNGIAKKPAVTIKYGSITLEADTDYTVSYSNNTNAGTALVTVSGKGNYTGLAVETFTIAKASPVLYFASNSVFKKTTDSAFTNTLTKITDGTVSLSSSNTSVATVNSSSGLVTIKGAGSATITANAAAGTNYNAGSASYSLTVSARSISDCTMTISPTSYTYDGTAKKPTVTIKNNSTNLTINTDYTVSYNNNTNAGTGTVTATGKGSYSGTLSKTFTIGKASPTLSFASSSVSKNTTDSAFTNTLTKKTDGTVTFSSSNTSVATVNSSSGLVTIKGAGNTTITANAAAGTNYIAGSASYTLTVTKPVTSAYQWGRDNWNFTNSRYDGFTSGQYISQINSSYVNRLKANLTNNEYRCIFDLEDGWIYDDWGGSCYGMSSLVHLAHNGYLPYANYKSGASKLYDLDLPKNNSNVSSLVTYYQMLQVKAVIQQQYRTVPTRSNRENIENIINLLSSNHTVLLGFKKTGWGGHAILAYDVEYGSYTWNGVTYQGCIKICDPNSSRQYDERYNIYFNTNSYNWAIPAYYSGGILSTRGATFNYVGANTGDINEGGYLSGSMSGNNSDFVARLDAYEISENRNIRKVRESNGNYNTVSGGSDDIVEDYSFISTGNNDEGVIGYNLYDSDSAYKVSQDNPDIIKLRMDYGNCYLEAESQAANSVIFDKKGYISIDSESADYNMAMTFNEDYPTDWFTIEVSGTGANEASLTKQNNGYLLTSDNLTNIQVDANNREEDVHVYASTSEQEVFICETDGMLDVKADLDHNGTFETSVSGKANLSKAVVTSLASETYSGSPLTPLPEVKMNGWVLKQGTDYKVNYKNNVNAGTATVVITGIGNYEGVITESFTINKAIQSIKASNLTLTFLKTATITASGNKGKLTYKSDNTSVATVDATGKVTAKGVGTTTISITAAATSNYNAAMKAITVKVSKADQSITAKASASPIAVGKTTTVSISGAKGAKSFKSSDTIIATVSSTGKVTAKKVGKVTITATSAATANYKAASKTVTIKVVPAATTSFTAENQATDIKLTWKKVAGANAYFIYRGSSQIAAIRDSSTVTYTDKKANTNGTKYTYEIIASASSTGRSTLSKSVTTYCVARPAISTLANSAASKMTVKWGKNAKATGYQIQYCPDKTFKTGNKSVSINSASTVSKVIGSLAKGKTYYVRIRTYKTAGSTKYFSAWGAVKSVKISK